MKPARSLATTTLLRMAIRISLLVCLTTGVAYWHLKETLTEKTYQQLSDYISARGARESQVFDLAASNGKRVVADTVAALSKGVSPAQISLFDQEMERRPDGSWRTKKEAADIETRASVVYAGDGADPSPELRARLAVMQQLATRFGQAYRDQFIDSYFTVPENGIVIFWPGVNWAEDLKADFDIATEEYGSVTLPEKNPSRQPVWTGTYLDTTSNTWMTSLLSPIYLQDRYIGAFGHDVTLNELMSRAIGDHLPGTKNVIVRADGRLISHPDRIEAIQKAAGGVYNVAKDPTLDPQLHDLWARVTEGGQPSGVTPSTDGASLLAWYHLKGPDWYFVVDYPTALITSEALSAAKFILGLGVFSLVAELSVLFWVMRREIAAPLQTLTDGAAKVANGDLKVQIDVRRDDELGVLASTFNTMTRAVAERDAQLAEHNASLEKTVAARTAALDARNQEMRTVLDHVEQGLVTIAADGVMAGERSAILDRWFGAPGEGQALSAYLRRHDAAFADSLEMGLQEIADGWMPLEVCLAQLPARLHAGPQTLSIQYIPILYAGALQQLLVVMTDISAELARQAAEAEQKDVLRVFEKIGKDRRGFLDFYEEANALVSQLTHGKPLHPAVEARLLHTLKGNAGLFGLTQVASMCHHVEEKIKDGEGFSREERSQLKALWARVQDKIAVMLGDKDQERLEVEKPDYEQVVALARKHDAPFLPLLESWTLDPVQARLERLGEQARALAERLGKPGLEVVADGSGLRLDGPRWNAFWSACVHLIRNAVDHGIEGPDAREALGKPRSGVLALRAAIQGESFVLSFEDDGAGIAWEKIAAKAAAAGMAHKTHEDLVVALFSDGISSRDEVSETSGRGVGMSAVWAEVEALGGRIHIASHPHLGTTFSLRFPKEAMGHTAWRLPDALRAAEA